MALLFSTSAVLLMAALVSAGVTYAAPVLLINFKTERPSESLVYKAIPLFVDIFY